MIQRRETARFCGCCGAPRDTAFCGLVSVFTGTVLVALFDVSFSAAAICELMSLVSLCELQVALHCYSLETWLLALSLPLPLLGLVGACQRHSAKLQLYSWYKHVETAVLLSVCFLALWEAQSLLAVGVLALRAGCCVYFLLLVWSSFVRSHSCGSASEPLLSSTRRV